MPRVRRRALRVEDKSDDSRGAKKLVPGSNSTCSEVEIHYSSLSTAADSFKVIAVMRVCMDVNYS